jgi:hypothetical protein
VSSTSGQLLIVAAAITALFAARFVVFRVSCTLSEAGEPGFARAASLVLISSGLGLALLLIMKRSSPATLEANGADLFYVVTAIIGSAPGAAFLYWWLLPTSLRRGAILSGTELLLGALLAALGTGLILVVLAGLQLKRRPQAAQPPPSTASAIRHDLA